MFPLPFVLFSVCVSGLVFLEVFDCFSLFLGASGEVAGVPFFSFGAFFRQRLAPSILNDSTTNLMVFQVLEVA